MSIKGEKAKAAVKDLIIGSGVAEGLFIYTGVNPFAELLKAIKPFTDGTQYEWYYALSWILLFIIIPAVQILATYGWGGMIGLFALLLSFVGAVFINTLIGILMVFAGVFLGYFSFISVNKVSFVEFIEFISKILNYFRK